MHFIVHAPSETIIGWTPKCGCSFVKTLAHAYLHDGEYIAHPHHKDLTLPLPRQLQTYNILMVMRNPYDRLLSGFFEKYGPRGQYHQRWVRKFRTQPLPLTFRNFVDVLVAKNSVIDQHHFQPQTTGLSTSISSTSSTPSPLSSAKSLRVFDLTTESQDIAQQMAVAFSQPALLSTALENATRNRNNTHRTVNPPASLDLSRIVDAPIQQINTYRIPTCLFYADPEIRAKVDTFYAADFAFYSAQTGKSYQLY